MRPIHTEQRYRDLLHEGHTPESAARALRQKSETSPAMGKQPKSRERQTKTGIQRRKYI